MSIKLKLFFLAIVYSFFLVCLLWYENITLENFNNIKDTKQHVNKLHISMLTLRRNEKDFLLRSDLEYVDRFKQNSKKINEEVNSLKEFLIQNGFDTSKSKEFNILIREYQKLFLILVEQYKINGLDSNQGLLKSFTNSINKFNDDKKEEYFKEILTLRDYEKSFILTKDMQYIDLYKTQFLKTIKQIPKNKTDHLKAYNRFFLEYINGVVLIGLNENLGIKGEMRKTVHQTEALLDELILEFGKISEDKLQSIEKNRAILITLLIILSMIIVFYQLYKITSSVLHLEKGLNGFFKFLNKQSKVVELLEIKSNDEIGKMSKSINENILNTSKRLEDERIKFEKELALKTKELSDLNEHLEQRIKDEVGKNTQKQIQLFEQSKMASLGSMIGNIIHQWRQPLTQISMVSSAVRLHIAMDQIKNEKLDNDMNTILERVKYMNEVLMTFRNFVMEKKEKKEVLLVDRIEKALNIVYLSLKDVHIDLIKSINQKEEIKITLVVGELEEVIINIINNAKDALLENKIKSPWINIDLKKENNKAIITIEDNAGGIPSNVLPHIFEENYTTKDKNVGTGLGLFMSYEIITKSLNGKIYCENTNDGAKFFIEIPIK